MTNILSKFQWEQNDHSYCQGHIDAGHHCIGDDHSRKTDDDGGGHNIVSHDCIRPTLVFCLTSHADLGVSRPRPRVDMSPDRGAGA